MRKTTSSRDELIDPDPFAILLALLGAFSTIGATLGPVLVKESFARRREQRVREEEIRDSFFDAYRALNSLERVLKDFQSYIEQYDLWRVELRVGRGSFGGTKDTIADIKRLYSDTNRSGKILLDKFIVLSGTLQDQDFNVVTGYVNQIDDSFNNAFRSRTYAECVSELSKLLGQLKRLIEQLGINYGFSPQDDSSYGRR